MTYQIALPSEQEQRLTAQAHLQGMNAQEYLQQIILARLEALPLPSVALERSLNAEAVETWLDELAERGEQFPVLASDALDRASLYADHD